MIAKKGKNLTCHSLKMYFSYYKKDIEEILANTEAVGYS